MSLLDYAQHPQRSSGTDHVCFSALLPLHFSTNVLLMHWSFYLGKIPLASAEVYLPIHNRYLSFLLFILM